MVGKLFPRTSRNTFDLSVKTLPWPEEGIKPMDDPGFTEEGEDWVNSRGRLSSREHSAST